MPCSSWWPKAISSPSADQIADIAKVGRRSVFRHFNDMDTLYREMTASITATMGSIVLQPFEAADWRGQVLELVDRRGTGFEKMKPFLLAPDRFTVIARRF